MGQIPKDEQLVCLSGIEDIDELMWERWITRLTLKVVPDSPPKYKPPSPRWDQHWVVTATIGRRRFRDQCFNLQEAITRVMQKIPRARYRPKNVCCCSKCGRPMEKG